MSLLLLSVPFSGCGSVMGRTQYGPRYPVYSGVVWDAVEIWVACKACGQEITGDTLVSCVGYLIDFPISLAVDTALLPIELTMWAFSQPELEQRPTTREMEAKDAKEPKTPAPDTPESIAYRWSVLRSLDGRFFFDKALGHGGLTVRCHARRLEIRPTRPQARASSEWETVPIETDGDAEDFYFRVTSRLHPMLQGELSETYRAFLNRR